MGPKRPKRFRKSTFPCEGVIQDIFGRLKMEKSTSKATQITEPPPCATSSLPTTADQRSSPAMVAMDLDSSAGVVATPRGRKRALEGNLKIENSNYYKMRLLLKDVRPHVLEVLRTPDLRNSKAAIEIQEKMKLMIELYQEMIGEAPKRESLSNGDGEMVVGGSAFGWNFITCGVKEAVYYGMSKEEYRSSHPITQVEAQVQFQNAS